MAKVALPDRGQPLDLAYIYQLAQAINNLSDQLSPVTEKSVIINTDGTDRSARTSDARVVGKTISVTQGLSVGSGQEVTVPVQLGSFAYKPIVTATPVINSEVTQSSTDVSVIIKEVTSSSATIVVRFNTIGVATVDVNVLAVGIPN